MKCSNCGCEIENGSTKCDVCGSLIKSEENIKPLDNGNVSNESITTLEKSLYKSKIVILSLIAAIVLVVIISAAVVANLSSSNNFADEESTFLTDEQMILGSWEMDTYGYENLNGIIAKITFYSDGTCTVNGVSAPENGYWSIVDNQLKVVGAMGGMFWNYHGFIMSYDLSSNRLYVYDENNSYTYYRE